MFCVSLLSLPWMIWGASYFVEPSQAHFKVATTGRAEDDVHMLIRAGGITLFNGFDVDSGGAIQPRVVDPRTHVSPRIMGIGRCQFPGFDLRYCRFVLGYVVWSLDMSLLIPMAVSLLGLVIFRRWQKPSATTGPNQEKEVPS